MGWVMARFGRDLWQRLGKAWPGLRPMTSTWCAPALFDLDELSRLLLYALHKSSRQKDLALIIRDPEGGRFRVRAKRGYEDRDLSQVQFAQDSPLVRHLSAHPAPTHCDQLERAPWFRFLPWDERDALTSLRGGLLVPLSTAGDPAALLVLGRRKSGLKRWRRDGLAAADCGQLASIIEEALLHQRLKAEHQHYVPAPQQAGQTEWLQHLERTIRGIVHDLNNTFATILGDAQLLEDEDRSGEVGWRAAAIRQAVLDSAESVRSLSRSWEVQGVRTQPTDLYSSTLAVNDIIKGALEMIEPHWRQGRISSSRRRGGSLVASGHRAWEPTVPRTEATFDNAEGSSSDLVVTLRRAGHISGSSAELRRAVTNIIFNSVDALPSEQGRIEIVSGQDAQWSIIRIRDNGSGIPGEIMGRIFEPFFTTKAQGSGLGLSISQSIIARHGGSLEVESMEGKGSTFTLFLPLAGEATPLVSSEQALSHPKGS